MSKDIKIFVTCHKKFHIPQCSLLYPVQAGATFNKKIDGYYYDDDGENISYKNKKYCELSVQYYAWKNHQADYYGFVHYRRYFSFSDQKFKTNWLNEIVVDDFTDFETKFGYDEKNIQDIIGKYDVIIPCRQLIGNVYLQYKYSVFQDIKDLKFCKQYICKKYPEMRRATKKYLKSFKGYCCNQFIMSKELFNDYSAWLFDILEQHEKFNSHENSDVQKFRVSGYLAERLFGIYITYLRQQKKYKIKELPRVVINNPNVKTVIKPETDCSVQIGIPLNTNYLATASTLLQSIIDNQQQKTEIVLLNSGVDGEHINNLKAQAKDSNCVIKNIDLPKNIDNYNKLIKNLPNLLTNYKNIILIKPNCLCNGPIEYADKERTISGVIDVDLVSNVCEKKKLFKKYSKQGLNPYQLICSDYLELNLQKLQKNCENLGEITDFSQILSANKQDLNILPQTKMYKFDSLSMRGRKVYVYIPHDLYEEYAKAKNSANIISFSGYYPPYQYPLTNFSSKYFEVARKTPYYELLIYNLCNAKIPREAKRYKLSREKMDKKAPVGSNKRVSLRIINKRYY